MVRLPQLRAPSRLHWLIGLAGFIGLIRPGIAQAPSLAVADDLLSTAPVASVSDALARMEAIERHLEELQGRQLEDEALLLEESQRLRAVTESLDEDTRLSEEGRRTLDEIASNVSQALEELSRRQAGERGSLAETRRAIRRAATLRLHREAAPGARTARARLALALLDRDLRRQASVSTTRLLRMQEEEGRLLGDRREAGEVAGRHTAFSRLRQQQLREQHEQLAGQVAVLQTTVAQQTEARAELAERRAELKQLIADLAEQETARAAEEPPPPSVGSPIPSPGPTPRDPFALDRPDVTPAPAPAATPVLPEATPPARAVRPPGGLPEVPYESGSEPLVSQTDQPRTGDAMEASEAGTRYLFWRALPVGVRALASGRVAFAGPFAGYRHLLIIDHGGGFRTLYGNLTGSDLAAGTPVAVGQVIGRYRAGQGARAEPLWFEIRRGVDPIRPGEWPALTSGWEQKLFVKLAEETM